MQLPATLKEISDLIIVCGSIVSALFIIWSKFILPLTSFGKKRIAKRQAEADAKTTELIKATTQEIIRPLSDNIDNLINNMNHVTLVNAEQNARIDDIDKKIDSNEIDRIRWELFQFARICHEGQVPSNEEFKHVFKLHQKYDDLISARHLTNGEMDMEYAFIRQYYLKVSDQNSDRDKT